MAEKARLQRDEPFCRLCQANVATIRDHIVPLAEGGADVPANTQHVCEDCHETKTRSEAIRGRQRA